MKNIIVGTAGHIDHGKSTLVKALTGIDPDRLKEEKERGITIDIGFADLELSSEVHIGFVDVPGHERFIKNMLAGIGGIDAVLLVVAADESIMPQTREHLDICALLKIPTGIIAITKCDIVDQDILEIVRGELRAHVKNGFLQNAPIIPVSAACGLGLDELKKALLKTAQSVPSRNSQAVFRLPIDRCFTRHGFGTIVTGTLMSGMISRDEEVEIYPTGRKSRIRNVQVHNRPVDYAIAGQRTALNLQNVEVSEIQRGMQLSVPNRFHPSLMVDTKLHLLETSPIPLTKRTRVRLHHGTSEVLATASPMGVKEILPGQTSFARVTLESSILAVLGDHFILRRISPMVTIGGGTILDARPVSSRKNLNSTLENLMNLDPNDLKKAILQLAHRSALSGIDEDQILSRTLAPREAIRAVLSELARSNQIEQLAENPFQAIAKKSFEQLCQKSVDAIKDFHTRQPLLQGISKGELYSANFKSSSQTCFKAVMDYLSARGQIVIEQDRVRLGGREVTLNQRESSAKQQIEEVFRKAGLKVPQLQEVLSTLTVPESQAKQLLLMLTKERKLIKISENLFFHTDSINQLKNVLGAYRKETEKIDVGKFKNLTGISRKYAIPLLEYLDRERITKRVGEFRMILLK